MWQNPVPKECMKILLLYESGMVEMDFFTENHIYWMQTQNKENKTSGCRNKEFCAIY